MTHHLRTYLGVIDAHTFRLSGSSVRPA